MKKFILCLLIVISFASPAQETHLNNTGSESCHLSIFKVQEDLYLCDSIYSFNARYGINFERRYFYYDDFGRRIKKDNHELNDNQDWYTKNSWEWIFNNDGLFIEYIWRRVTLSRTEELTNYRYHYHFFNEQQQMIKDSILKWNELEEKYEIDWIENLFYNEDGQLDYKVASSWDDEQEIWTASGKQINTYNSEKLLAEKLIQHWDDIDGNWKNSRNYTYNYIDGYLHEYFWKTWKEEGQFWKNVSKSTYDYDDTNLLTYENKYLWDLVLEAWTPDIWYHYLYSDSYLDEKLTYYWSEPDSIWSNPQSDEYYYSYHLITDRYEINLFEGLSVFPNPTSHSVQLEFNIQPPCNLLLMNASGQIVYQKITDQKIESIDLSTFESGIYFLVIKAKDEYQVKKLFKY